MTLVLSGTNGVSAVDGSAATPAIQGNDSNTGVFFPAADTVAVATGGSERMRVDSSGNVGIGTSSPQRKLDVTVSDTTTAQVYLRNNNASYASGLIVYNAGGEASMFRHNGASDTSYAGANSVNIGSITNNVVGFITNNTERARIDTDGNLLVARTSVVNQGRISVDMLGGTNVGLSVVNTNGGNTGNFCNFARSDTTVIGAIQQNGASAVTYSTSSDYRLKEDIAPMTGALAKVALLKPCTYKWKVDGSDGQGFIAHELAEVVPQCVTGEKDAVDAEGNPVYQGIDTSFLSATLAAAIQELHQIVQAQAAEIAELKANLP
jgi:hypothetical protein